MTLVEGYFFQIHPIRQCASTVVLDSVAEKDKFFGTGTKKKKKFG